MLSSQVFVLLSGLFLLELRIHSGLLGPFQTLHFSCTEYNANGKFYCSTSFTLYSAHEKCDV